jgi:hypothetical protein
VSAFATDDAAHIIASSQMIESNAMSRSPRMSRRACITDTKAG